MKIVDLKCKKCQAVYETLESVPMDSLKCPACSEEDFERTITDKEFKGCGGSCSSCDSC